MIDLSLHNHNALFSLILQSHLLHLPCFTPAVNKSGCLNLTGKEKLQEYRGKDEHIYTLQDLNFEVEQIDLGSSVDS